MAITRSGRRVSRARIETLAGRLLDASELCAIATVSPAARAHVNTAYFAWTPEFHLVWVSEPRARHSLNLVTNPAAAIAVYDSAQTWGEADRGIQLFGSARETAGPRSRDAERIYSRRFPASTGSDLSAYHFYRFRARRLKLFDERALGAGVFVTASVDSAGRVTWRRTDVYRATRDG
jgi:uncharacterized protein YhbP (UPF0306 family)